MKFWLRLHDPWFCSWYVVFKELKKALEDTGHDVKGSYVPPADAHERVEVWWGDPLLFTWHGKGIGKVAIVLSEHDSMSSIGLDSRLAKLKEADILFAPSRAALRVYEEAPLDMPMGIWKFGVNLKNFPFVSRDFTERPLKLLHLGVAQFRKGSWLLLDAFKTHFAGNREVQLTIACGTENRHEQVELFPQYQEVSNIHIDRTFYKNTWDVLKGHHLLIAPHLAEGYGLAIPEAMATGMPCLVSRCSAPREYFHQDSGWWIEMSQDYAPVSRALPNTKGLWKLPSQDSMVERIRQALNHPEECEVKAYQARQRARTLRWSDGASEAVQQMKEVLL